MKGQRGLFCNRAFLVTIFHFLQKEFLKSSPERSQTYIYSVKMICRKFLRKIHVKPSLPHGFALYICRVLVRFTYCLMFYLKRAFLCLKYKSITNSFFWYPDEIQPGYFFAHFLPNWSQTLDLIFNSDFLQKLSTIFYLNSKIYQNLIKWEANTQSCEVKSYT